MIPKTISCWLQTATTSSRYKDLLITLVAVIAVTTQSGVAFAQTADSLKLFNQPLFFQYQLASSSETDFHQSVAYFDYERSPEGSYVTAFSVGRKVSDTMFVWPFDVVAYASVQKLNERGYQSDSWGASLYAKAYQEFNLPYADIPIRLGFGQGLSYVSRIPVSESRDFLPHSSEKLLYYLDYSLQIPVESLPGINQQHLPQSVEKLYIGYTVWHRSTLFGLMGDSTAGINYIGLSVEALFNGQQPGRR